MKILVVDDHTLIREARRGVLQELKPEAGVIDASRGRGALELATMSAGELGLTERQIDVLATMMQGQSNKARCRELDLAEATVKNHITAILRALKVTNRPEAVIAGAAFGWKLKAPRP